MENIKQRCFFIVFLIFFIFQTFYSCNTVKKSFQYTSSFLYFEYHKLKRNPYALISFNLGFENDTASLKINDVKVFENLLFVSKHTNCGSADYEVLIKREDGKLLVGINNFVEKTWEYVVINKKSMRNIYMKFQINQSIYEFDVNLKKGRYVHFYMGDSLTYHQNITLVGCD